MDVDNNANTGPLLAPEFIKIKCDTREIDSKMESVYGMISEWNGICDVDY